MSKKIRRLAKLSDALVQVTNLVSQQDIEARRKSYAEMTPMSFSKLYKDVWQEPVEIAYKGATHKIQVNFCSNPFCKWYSMPQKRFDEAPNKPYRYKLGGSDDKYILCNPDPLDPKGKPVLGNSTGLYSNWAIAEEIKRLVTLNSVVDVNSPKAYHHPGCSLTGITPYDDEGKFDSYGFTKANTPRRCCIECKKVTCLVPERASRSNHRKKRNEVLPKLFRKVLTGSHVRAVISALGIGHGTFYDKVELIYQRCLEFQERHESKLSELTPKKLWINTDAMIYYLNSLRKHGSAIDAEVLVENPDLETALIASVDKHTRYIFRADINYDSFVRLSDIERDTEILKEDHLPSYATKNDRLRIPFAPQPPTALDYQTPEDFIKKLEEFEDRRNYIDGMHTNPTYTAFAHFWLLKQTLHPKYWNFVTDKDSSLTAAIHRIFAPEIASGRANHFICTGQWAKTNAGASKDYREAKVNLKIWAEENDIPFSEDNPHRAAITYLAEILKEKPIYVPVKEGDCFYVKHAGRPVRHPLPVRYGGYRMVDCLTDLSGYDPVSLAGLLLRANMRAVDSFFSICRDRIGILERPGTTAKHGAKSYKYANINPKYAQQMVTILRTWYNFCFSFKKNETRLTPAQRRGIADRKYDEMDILYFK